MPEVRIVGDASEEDKTKIRREILASFGEGHWQLKALTEDGRKAVRENEVKKTRLDEALIAFANEKTNELMKQCGVKPYDVPAENFHLVPAHTHREVADESGKQVATVVREIGGVILNNNYFRQFPPFASGLLLFHETLHVKGHHTVEVQKKEGKLKASTYRDGLTVIASQYRNERSQYHQHFTGLEEGLIAACERNCINDIMNLPECKSSKMWMSTKQAKKFRSGLAARYGIPEDEIVWVSHDGAEFIESHYRGQRKVLDYVIQEIQKQFPQKFANTEAVFMEFLKAHFTGRLLPIARMVEKTFGHGSFETLGLMGDDPETPVMVKEYLARARSRAHDKSAAA